MAFQIAMYNKQWASQVVQWEKNLPATKETQEIWVKFLGREDPLEEGMATHSSIPAWRIPWTGAWQATVHVVTESRTQLKRLSTDGRQTVYNVEFLPSVQVLITR